MKKVVSVIVLFLLVCCFAFADELSFGVGSSYHSESIDQKFELKDGVRYVVNSDFGSYGPVSMNTVSLGFLLGDETKEFTIFCAVLGGYRVTLGPLASLKLGIGAVSEGVEYIKLPSVSSPDAFSLFNIKCGPCCAAFFCYEVSALTFRAGAIGGYYGLSFSQFVSSEGKKSSWNTDEDFKGLFFVEPQFSVGIGF